MKQYALAALAAWGAFSAAAFDLSDLADIRFAERYAELMGTVLSERHLIEVLTAMADELRPVLPEHIAVWKEPVNMKTWETNLEFTKRLIKERRQKVGDMVTRYMKISRKQWEAMLAKYEDQ